MIQVESMYSGPQGWKEVAGLGCWRWGKGNLGKRPRWVTEAGQFAVLVTRSPCRGPARLASILRITHNRRKISGMQQGKTTGFLVYQKFPSHFSLIFHNLVHVRVLAGLLLDVPSSANTGSSWDRSGLPHAPQSQCVLFHLQVPEVAHLEKALCIHRHRSKSAQGTCRSIRSFVILLRSLLVLMGSLQAPSSPPCHLTHRLALQLPFQEIFSLILSFTNDNCHNSCLLVLGFPFPTPQCPPKFGDNLYLIFLFHLLLASIISLSCKSLFFSSNTTVDNHMPLFNPSSEQQEGLVFANLQWQPPFPRPHRFRHGAPASQPKAEFFTNTCLLYFLIAQNPQWLSTKMLPLKAHISPVLFF